MVSLLTATSHGKQVGQFYWNQRGADAIEALMMVDGPVRLHVEHDEGDMDAAGVIPPFSLQQSYTMSAHEVLRQCLRTPDPFNRRVTRQSQPESIAPAKRIPPD
jgi:hypothetical protein